jgi:nitrate/TMAO reductase-like tetraheme cytochrome c subunit
MPKAHVHATAARLSEDALKNQKAQYKADEVQTCQACHKSNYDLSLRYTLLNSS